MPASRVMIGLPVYGPMSTYTVQSILGIVLRSRPLIHDVRMVGGSYIDVARNTVAKCAADDPVCTHLFFIDMDMVILPHALERLLTHRKPVAGAWYCDKGEPPTPTAWNFTPEFERLEDVGEGLQLVGGVPMGCTLIETGVLRAMRDKFDDEEWFACGLGLGEDVHFAGRLRQMGVESYLDNDLVCGHIKEAIVTRSYWEHCRRNREAIAASKVQMAEAVAAYSRENGYVG